MLQCAVDAHLPTDFERAVLKSLAARSGDAAVRRQLANVRIAERDYTVVGCYSNLQLPIDTVASAAPYAARGPLMGPCFESKVVKYGGGTLLWFKAGRADCLEIYVNGDYFPADHSELGDFRLEGQLTERRRAMRQKLRTFWTKLRRAVL